MCFYFLFCLKYMHIPLFGHLQLTCLSLLSPPVLYLFNISNLYPSLPFFLSVLHFILSAFYSSLSLLQCINLSLSSIYKLFSNEPRHI
ncbi:hypothetical protein FKM82_025783 [Ascaphus truei]